MDRFEPGEGGAPPEEAVPPPADAAQTAEGGAAAGQPPAEAAGPPPEAGAAQAVDAAEVARLRARLEEATALAERYFNSLARAQADLENYRRRVERERERLEEAALEPALRKLLPVVDHLEMAVEASARGQGEAQVREGVELTLRQFREVLAGLGVEIVDPVGRPFDPEEHEAVCLQPSRLEPGTVVSTLRKGYSFRSRVLRPAAVVVAGPAEGAGPPCPTGPGPDPGSDEPGGKDDEQGSRD